MYTIDRENLNRLLKISFLYFFFFFLFFFYLYVSLFHFLWKYYIVYVVFLPSKTVNIRFDIYVWRPFCLDRASFVDVNAFNLAWISRKSNVIHRGITNISFLGCFLNLKRCTSKLNIDSSVQQWLHYQNCNYNIVIVI